MKFSAFLLFGCLFFVSTLHAQQGAASDSGALEPVSPNLNRFANHSPQKATRLALFLPGAGQVYNQRLWKAPIVWLGLGYLGSQVASNHRNYIAYRNGYRWRSDTIKVGADPFPNEPDRNLQLKRDEFRIERDKNFLFFLAFYGLQIIDARVDAHLRTFDVSNNLSMRIKPVQNLVALNPTQQWQLFTGVQITLHIK